MCSPDLTPIDQFRLELDELWVPGAHVATLNGRKMFVGIVRHFGEGSEAEAHQDVFAWDAPTSPEALAGQLTAIVYLSLPVRGGQLAIWNLSLSHEEYERQRVPNSYGLRRETLPDPDVVLEPEQGELILFNAGLVHAVEKIEVGSRVTWSCFIGFRGANDSLVVWS
jgi:hypothetical protein